MNTTTTYSYNVFIRWTEDEKQIWETRTIEAPAGNEWLIVTTAETGEQLEKVCTDYDQAKRASKYRLRKFDERGIGAWTNYYKLNAAA